MFKRATGRRQKNKALYRAASILIAAGLLLSLYSLTLAVYYTDAMRLAAANWGWTNGPYGEGIHVLDLYAGAAQNDPGKGQKVGTVTVMYEGGEVTVTYLVTGGAYLSEAHLHVGANPWPIVRRGDRVEYTNAPGLFPYKSGPLDPGTSTYTFGPYPFGGEIYVAAHAVVCYPAEYQGGEVVRVWLAQELLETVPGPGGGDLFDRLLLTVQYEGAMLYEGPMSGLNEPLELTGRIGPLVPGQLKELDITVYLPGPDTGNEYQGSSVKSSFSVLVQSSANCTVTLSPDEPLFSLGNLNPGDRYRGRLGFVITFTPSYTCETAWGLDRTKDNPETYSSETEMPPEKPETLGWSEVNRALPRMGGVTGIPMVMAGVWLRRKTLH